MSKAIFIISCFLLGSVAQAKTIKCFEEQLRSAQGDNSYSVSFNSEITLPKNKADNFSKRFSFKRQFGCTIFSKEPVLSGKYKAVQGYYLKSTCADKTDYAYMQFANSEGKNIFRIQCEKSAYEDLESEKFVPGAQDVTELLSDIITVVE